jgi:hypothetical protein
MTATGSRRNDMPFDCTPIIEAPKRLPTAGAIPWTAEPIRARPVPNWHVSRQPERLDDVVAVLAGARELLADEQRWCKRSFARTWLDIPVPAGSALARRYCALGAIMRAGQKLGLPVTDARRALEWQTVRPISDWNDEPRRTHGEVIATFNAAIAALGRSTV